MDSIRNWNDLFGAALHASERFGGGKMWFRGQSSLEWPLKPKIFRMDRQKHENNVVYQFKMQASAMQPSCPAIDDDIGWISLMQHFGAPTRLLDWSESILTAAFFAVGYEPATRPAVIWALNPMLLNKFHSSERRTQLLLPQHSDVARICNRMYGQVEDDALKAVGLLAINRDLRMLLQQARFTLHGNTEALEAISDHEQFLMKFTIPGEVRHELRNALHFMGVNMVSLFPDLPHLSRYLQEVDFLPLVD